MIVPDIEYDLAGTPCEQVLGEQFCVYNGNVQNAEKFAVEQNINIANKALRYLKNNYEGKKP